MVIPDPDTFLTTLTQLTRDTGLRIDLDIGGALVFRPVDPTDLRQWAFYWDKEREVYQLAPEADIDEP